MKAVNREAIKQAMLLKAGLDMAKVLVEKAQSDNLAAFSEAIAKAFFIRQRMDAIRTTPAKVLNRNGRIDKRRYRRFVAGYNPQRVHLVR